MAAVDTERLRLALEAGFLADREPRLYVLFHPSIETACKILDAIDENYMDGLTVEQLSHRLGLAKNTVLIYTRWLESEELIISTAPTGRLKIFFPLAF